MKQVNNINLILWLAVFSIAMGFLESAVVVYLRELYYPEGFQFPLVPMESRVAVTELGREVSTVVMLLSLAWVVTHSWMKRLAAFIFCFGTWDIFYYVFLKLLVGWPESLFTWDILFLVPVPWVGPVLAPVMVALLMIVMGGFLLARNESSEQIRIPLVWWMSLVLANVLMLFSMMQDYIFYLSQGRSGSAMWNVDGTLFEDLTAYVPEVFNWPLFLAGYALALLFVLRLFRSGR